MLTNRNNVRNVIALFTESVYSSQSHIIIIIIIIIMIKRDYSALQS